MPRLYRMEEYMNMAKQIYYHNLRFESRVWKEISDRVTAIALPILPHIRSRKLRSEIISNLFESQAALHFQSLSIPVQVCESDRQPDLTFTDTNKTLEIKVTGSDHTIAEQFKWMGGKYSKRSSDYIFIAYCYTPATTIDPTDTIKYYITKTYVDENEWRTIDNGNENYYATIYTTNDMKDNEILVGRKENKIYVLE